MTQLCKPGLLVGLCMACGTVPSVATAPRELPRSRHASIRVPSGGNLIMAMGDSLRVQAKAFDCYFDECLQEGHRGGEGWTSESAGLAVTARGVLHAKRPGLYWVSARAGEVLARDTVRVLPAVRSLTWNESPRVVSAGDTLRVSAVARDSSGAIIYRLGATAHLNGTSGSGEILRWDVDGYTSLYVNRPGLIVLVAHLAHRADTLRLQANYR